MKVAELLNRLEKEAQVKVLETRTLADGTQVLILVGKLPDFPRAGGTRWYSLVISKGQEDVNRREVEAILRHFWQLQLEFFPDKVVTEVKSVLRRP